MDPLSITASTIAVLGLCRKLYKGLKSVSHARQAPEEIAIMLEESQDLASLLIAIQQVSQHRCDIDELCDYSLGLKRLLRNAQDILVLMARLCGLSPDPKYDDAAEAISGLSPPQSMRLRNRYQWIRDRKRVSECCRKLSRIRLDIANHLALLSL